MDWLDETLAGTELDEKEMGSGMLSLTTMHVIFYS
jgi:hypothetical protein